MQTRDQVRAPLQDYPDRSIWTTWSISYNTIREQDEAAANLLLLWSFLDNKDLWFELFTAACGASARVAREVSGWIGDLANNEVEFRQSIQLLCSYSLVESVEETTSYATHPVVHKWARYYRGQDFGEKLARLAMVVVGWAVPHSSRRDYSVLQRRLLPHAQACSRWMMDMMESNGSGEREVVLDAVHLLGMLYVDQGKLAEAEKMYRRALQGYEKALGPKYTSTLDTVNNLGNLYKNQDKLAEAEKMYMRALQGKEETLGPKHISTLETVNNLGLLYKKQGKLAEAEKMYMRALQGNEDALGPKHKSTLSTVNNLGNLYKNQNKLAEAEEMYMRAFQGYEEALGPEHTSTLYTVNNLGSLYKDQGKLTEAEKMYMRALQGREEALGPKHIATLDTINSLGNLYKTQGKLAEAEKMYIQAFQGREEALGPNHTSTLDTLKNLGNLYKNQGRLTEAEKMYIQALQGCEKTFGSTHTSTLFIANSLREIYSHQGRFDDANEMYKQAMPLEVGKRSQFDSRWHGDEQNAMSIVYSDEDSILTDPDGPQSSINSFTPMPGVARLALDEFITLLLNEATIGDLCAEALMLQKPTAERLWRTLRRLLKRFASDLMQEANKDKEKAAAACFRSFTSYILNGMKEGLDQSTRGGNLAVEIEDEDRKRCLNDLLQNEEFRSENNIPRSQGSFAHDSVHDFAYYIEDAYNPNPNVQFTNNLRDETEESSKESEEAEESSEESEGALDSVRTFILGSEAFSTLQQKLQNFIYPSFASELESLTQMFSPQSLAKKGIDADSTEATECYHRLSGLALDLISVDFDSILIEYANLCTQSDQLKLSVESATGRRWHWWPLLDPIVPLAHDSAYMCWICVSESQEISDIL